jgi:hypothetical protein
MNNIWYLEHPTFRYEEAVKGLAKEAGLVIVDPENAPADRPGAAEVVPAVTLRPEFRSVPQQVMTTEPQAEATPAADEKQASKSKLKAAKATAAVTQSEKE